MHRFAVSVSFAILLLLLVLLSLTWALTPPQVDAVAGVIYLDGVPLDRAVLQFWHKDNLDMPCGAGCTDESGHFQVTREHDRNWVATRCVIQVADLNALNATMAVIKGKKLFGFYMDFQREHLSTYAIETQLHHVAAHRGIAGSQEFGH